MDLDERIERDAQYIRDKYKKVTGEKDVIQITRTRTRGDGDFEC